MNWALQEHTDNPKLQNYLKVLKVAMKMMNACNDKIAEKTKESKITQEKELMKVVKVQVQLKLVYRTMIIMETQSYR